MMKHTNRKRVVELARQRQPVNVCLNDVRVGKRTRGHIRRLHRLAYIDTYNFTRAPLRGKLRVTPFAATAFEHNLVAEKLRRNGSDPAEELFRVALVCLSKVLPLPTEVLSGRLLVLLHRSKLGETRNAACDRKRGHTRAATQFAFDDLRVFRM